MHRDHRRACVLLPGDSGAAGGREVPRPFRPRAARPAGRVLPNVGRGGHTLGAAGSHCVVETTGYAWQDEFRLVFSTTGALDFQNLAFTLEHVTLWRLPSAADHQNRDIAAASLRDICRVHDARPTRHQLGCGGQRDERCQSSRLDRLRPGQAPCPVA